MTTTPPLADFERTVLASSNPTLVAFLADWCAPCRATADMLNAFRENVDGLVVRTMDIDASPQVPQAFGVRAVPTLILFSDGRPLGVHVGAVSKTRLVVWLETLLGAA